MKAIIIARVSTEEQKEAGLSLPAQIQRLENYCKSKNFPIIKSFSFDESAYKDTREEFDQIFNCIIEQKEKIAVCCDKVDRLSRNMFDKRVSYLYDKALRDEIELHFTSDGQIINSKISAAEKFNFSISLKKINSDYGLNWSKGKLDYVLKNKFYHGIMVCNGKEYPHRYTPLIPFS